MSKVRVWGLRSLIGFVVVVALLAGWALTIPSADAAFFPGLGVWVYYSDATYTTVVGARGTGCCGTVINWGIVTQWSHFERIYCLDVVCPQYQ